MSCGGHGCPISNHSKVVPVTWQSVASCNDNDTGLKTQTKGTLIVQVLDSKSKISSSERKSCQIDYQDKVESWGTLDLPSSPIGDSVMGKPCPDFHCSPTHDFQSSKACSDIPSPPKQDFLLRKAPTYPSSLIRKAYRDSRNRLPSVIEESESFAKRELSSIVPPVPLPSYYRNFDVPSIPASRDPVADKSLANLEVHAPVFRETRVKTTKRRSLGSFILCPLKIFRDAYVKCMMSIAGAGDFTGMVHGGHVVGTGAYFAESPLSKTDSINFG